MFWHIPFHIFQSKQAIYTGYTDILGSIDTTYSFLIDKFSEHPFKILGRYNNIIVNQI